MKEAPRPKLIEINLKGYIINIFYTREIRPDNEIIEKIIEKLEEVGEKNINGALFIFKKVEGEDVKTYEINVVIGDKIKYKMTIKYNPNKKEFTEEEVIKTEE